MQYGGNEAEETRENYLQRCTVLLQLSSALGFDPKESYSLTFAFIYLVELDFHLEPVLMEFDERFHTINYY